ncbi:EAL domain-containing protein [Devosia sp. SD17-2]|jgi:EAL domain-containing protein (putative c-di-GMP-specific phosphodiesterase class I)|uniref:putative bifunctional diguanylate cyclase/phosphodiesterase n=1 Tax=Devosia sp. SD17-2 TaxID=2976459 RepID=UPI0023D89C5D|nr:EAL domain-containing protein [Devosia sp. SD17-2]WEJ34249.1 EAL domain-containing protein [Devosia sp. SD17-2]
MFDVPSADAPRVSHLYLLVIAALGYLNYRRQPSGVQIGLVVICLASFVALASSTLSTPLAMPVPDSVRIAGSWVNTIVAVGMLCGCAYAMQAEFTSRGALSRDLMAALWNEEFHLVYQPQVDRERSTIGAEALLRWTSPQRGALPPAEFIPEAERSGLMVRIGGWVLEEGCRTLAEWNNHPEFQHLTLSVNVSVRQLLNKDFEPLVRKVLASTGADPRKLTLELTESVLVTEMDVVVGKLKALHELGITIALDDFGTGYSSLSYLRRLPVQQLKIDRGFVQDAVKSARSASLAENVIRLGHDLGQHVLAEGVETEQQHDFLARAGCVQFQGYLYGRPMQLTDFERRIGLEARSPTDQTTAGMRTAG